MQRLVIRAVGVLQSICDFTANYGRCRGERKKENDGRWSPRSRDFCGGSPWAAAHPPPPAAPPAAVFRRCLDMKETLRIALFIESSRQFGRELLRGISAYSREHGPWLFSHQERRLNDPLLLDIKRWSPDGIMVRFEEVRNYGRLRNLRVPVVDLFPEIKSHEYPYVITDHHMIAQQAVQHFHERGFQNFAYCGYPQLAFSYSREMFFVAESKHRSIRPHVLQLPPVKDGKRIAIHENDTSERARTLAKWLKQLPKPVAVFACNDILAYQIINVCNAMKIRVPEEVSVLGVDNDPVFCDISNPSLSSVDPNAANIGYEAAALLHKLIRKQTPEDVHIVVPSKGVMARRSTDVLAIQIPEVAEAIRYVRRHAFEPLTAVKMVRDLNISRATLQNWFLTHLGHSVKTEITLTRVKHIQDLLLNTDESIETIARRSGFLHVVSMFRVFKKHVGLTPGEYRRQEKVQL